MLSERKLRKLFERKDVAEICRTLRQHNIVDVNDCSVLTPHSARSVLSFAIESFHPDVMWSLLNDFGADLNVVCVSDAEGVDWYPLEIAYCMLGVPEYAVRWLLEHGSSPFVFLDYSGPEDPWNESECLVERARDRLRTAWAATWVLSQRPHALGAWGLRVMAQQVAQCIMETPLREVSEVCEDSRKKRKI